MAIICESKAQTDTTQFKGFVNDAFGLKGNRIKDMQSIAFVEFEIVGLTRDNVINALGKPDIICHSNSGFSFRYYYEGYMYREYFSDINTANIKCDIDLPIPISYMVVDFNSSGIAKRVFDLKKGG